MGENLRTRKYKYGTDIPLVTEKNQWASPTPASCYYENNENNSKDYGMLYNWYSISTGHVCPYGWHVATRGEWMGLFDILGGQDIAGGMLKETGSLHWGSMSPGTSNSSGFSALP